MVKKAKSQEKKNSTTAVELYSSLSESYWTQEVKYNELKYSTAEDFYQQIEKILDIDANEELKTSCVPNQLIEVICQTKYLSAKAQKKLVEDLSHVDIAYVDSKDSKDSNELDLNQFLSLILKKFSDTKSSSIMFFDRGVLLNKMQLLPKKEFLRIVDSFIYYLEIIIEASISSDSFEDSKIEKEDPNSLTFKLGISSVKINAYSPFEEDLKDREEIDEFYMNEVYQKFLPNNVFKIKDEKCMQLQLCYKENSMIIFNADGSIEYYTTPFSAEQLASKKYRKYIFDN